MRSRAFTLSVLILAALATPAFATIQFSYCYFGCTNTNAGMTYTAFQAITSGLTFPVSPITFSAPNLSAGGIYTDPATGAIFTGYNGNTTQEALTTSGTSLAQTVGGQFHSIQIDLPLNTYAVAMFLSSVSGASNPFVGLTTRADLNAGAVDYSLTITGSSDSVFFGVVSTVPISQLFIGNIYNFNSAAFRILDFETGQTIPVTDTPEASTLAMIGGGLLLVRFLRKPGPRKLTQHPVVS